VMKIGMIRCRARPVARSGYVLVVVVAIAAVLAITGTGLRALGVGTYGRALYASQEIAARSAAEAGGAAALCAMKSYDGVHLPSATNVSLPGCNASYTYTVSLGTPSGFAVASSGSAGSATKTIRVCLACRRVSGKARARVSG
jgi:hypothetical protein